MIAFEFLSNDLANDENDRKRMKKAKKAEEAKLKEKKIVEQNSDLKTRLRPVVCPLMSKYSCTVLVDDNGILQFPNIVIVDLHSLL